MSKITPINIQNLTQLSDLTRFTQPFFTQTTTALNNGLTFQDNIRSSLIAVQFPSTANQNIQIAHNLNALPTGYIPVRLSAACNVYDGLSAVIGTTFLNLKCSIAGVTATILVF